MKFSDAFLSSLSLSVILIICTSFVSAYGPEADSCYSFGGGNVFPEGNRRVDHKLQVTKAVSESNFNFYAKSKNFSFMILQNNVILCHNLLHIYSTTRETNIDKHFLLLTNSLHWNLIDNFQIKLYFLIVK